MSSLIMSPPGFPPDDDDDSVGLGSTRPQCYRPEFSDREYQELFTWLKCIGIHKGVKPSEASELAQATLYQMVLLIQRLGNGLEFENESRFRAWLQKIFWHILQKHFHARARHKTVEPPSGLVDPGDSPSTIYGAEAMRRLVDGLLARLDPRDEKIVRWRLFDDQTYEFIGNQIGMTDVHARTLYHKALKQLRVLLADADPSAYL